VEYRQQIVKRAGRFAVNLLQCHGLRGGGGPREKISIVKIKPELSFSVVTELLNRIPGPVRRNEFQNKKIHECIIRAFAGITDAPLSTVEKLTVAHSFNKPDDFI